MVCSFLSFWINFIIIQNILSNKTLTNKMRMNRGNYVRKWMRVNK